MNQKIIQTILILLLCLLVTGASACSSSSKAKDFSILGAWEQTYGSSGWESSNGRIVQFNDSHQCNIFSPQDTYGISDRGDDGFSLSVTGLLGGNLRDCN
jgi:hypothetical protein